MDSSSLGFQPRGRLRSDLRIHRRIVVDRGKLNDGNREVVQNQVYDDVKNMCGKHWQWRLPSIRRFGCISGLRNHSPDESKPPRARLSSFNSTPEKPMSGGCEDCKSPDGPPWRHTKVQRTTQDRDFLNAGNRMAEGSLGSPVRDGGRKYLEATRRAWDVPRIRVPRMAYREIMIQTTNHARFLRGGLDSVLDKLPRLRGLPAGRLVRLTGQTAILKLLCGGHRRVRRNSMRSTRAAPSNNGTRVWDWRKAVSRIADIPTNYANNRLLSDSWRLYCMNGHRFDYWAHGAFL